MNGRLTPRALAWWVSHRWIIFLPLLLACGLFALPTASFSPRPFVEGMWVPSGHTLEFMDQMGYEFTSHSIEFLTDGTVVITNIPSEWFFHQESSIKGFYSGTANWSLSEENKVSLDNLQLNLNVVSPAGEEANIEIGTELDYLEFYPANHPEEVHWVTFQKCYPHFHITDEFLEPLVDALNQSNRDNLGFSPITIDDIIEIDGTIGTTDISLHAYNDFSSHGIFFRLRDNQYFWIFEQEIFTGPEKWYDSDGATWEETITIQYQTEDIYGGPINDLMVDYFGHDPRLINRSDNWYLSKDINDVLPILEEWKQWRANEPPSPQSLCL